MNEQGKGSMLLPLGIGAGLLLLLTSMKKKEQPPVTAAIPDDAAALLPQVNAGEAAVPQIDPAPAPTYAQAQAKTAPSEDSEGDGGEEDEETPDPQQPEGEKEDSSTDDEETDDSGYASSANRGGGGGYTPYSPSSSINTNRQTTPLPATSTAQATTYFANGKPVIGNKAIRFQSDQAKLLAMQKARNNKSLRFQSDQARKFAQRSGVKTANPLIIGNGKPRMGVPLPASYRPGATTALQQPIAITSQQPAAATAATPVASQSTIFPLKFGTTSAYVKEVQRKLGVSPTGYFGTMTRAAIQKRFRVMEISEALYKQIITGKAPAAVAPVRKPVPKIIRKASKPIPKKHKIIKRK